MIGNHLAPVEEITHVAEFIKNNGGTQHVLTRLQTSFSSALANVAKEAPNIYQS